MKLLLLLLLCALAAAIWACRCPPHAASKRASTPTCGAVADLPDGTAIKDGQLPAQLLQPPPVAACRQAGRHGKQGKADQGRQAGG